MEPDTSVEQVARDPVCGMAVERAGARHTARHRGQTYYFCCARCRERFVEAPEDFLNGRQAEPAPEGSLYTCPMDPEIVQATPGDCPICGMALEPMMPVADAGPSPELRDLTRRLWLAGPLAGGRVRAGDGEPRGHSLRFLDRAAALRRPAVPAGDARALDRPCVLPAGSRLGAQPRAQHVDTDRARHRRRLALQPRRACSRPASSLRRSSPRAGSRRPISRRRR